jgi:hypothetical protein
MGSAWHDAAFRAMLCTVEKDCCILCSDAAKISEKILRSAGKANSFKCVEIMFQHFKDTQWFFPQWADNF